MTLSDPVLSLVTASLAAIFVEQEVEDEVEQGERQIEHELMRELRALRAEVQKGEASWRKKLRDRRYLFRPLQDYGFGLLTFVLIVISVVVALYSKLGDDPQLIMRLFITEYSLSDNLLQWNGALPEIRHGQVWRLITPIFIHFGLLHLFFNMLWLRDLGSMIEARQSWKLLAVLVLVIAAGSNLAQYFFGGPMFGGMSGVVYGLLGYIWIRGKLDPGSGLYLHQSTVTMMLIWLAIGFTGFLGIANGAHLGGLVAGVGWGYLSSLRFR